MVHVCRLNKTYKEGIGKITLSVNSSIACIFGAVLRLLVVFGATALHGAPPRGPLERQVEQALRRNGAQI
eukprot:16256024-Heterocapsa_arctica.AAC.1